MAIITNETRVIDLTVGELKELISHSHQGQETIQSVTEVKPRRLVYGMAGIASLFNCSITTANRIKKSGRINDAITQHGRIIVVDADYAIELFDKK